jgi:SAM-dependent methyltransferase
MTELATFTRRDSCIGCGAHNLAVLSSGSFEDEPLRGFIEKDPWGENPLPSLAGASWEYVQCRGCDLTFHRKVLSPEWEKRKWERWVSADAIAEFERLHVDPFDRGVHFTHRALEIERLTRGNGRIAVLDFGCGDGQFLEQCRMYGFDAVGVDRSTPRAEKNRARIHADLSELQGMKFHAVTLFEVLEHLAQPRQVLEALKPLLAPGGILLLETPNATGVTGIKSRHDYLMIHPLDHINGFTPRTLRDFAERLGFKAIKAPVSHVTTNTVKVAKGEVRRVLPRVTTQQYFTVAWTVHRRRSRQ